MSLHRHTRLDFAEMAKSLRWEPRRSISDRHIPRTAPVRKSGGGS